MNTKDYSYSWHLSLRVDRPLEGCAMKPHAYMYGKKLDETMRNENDIINNTAAAAQGGAAAGVLALNNANNSNNAMNNNNGGNNNSSNINVMMANNSNTVVKRMKEPPPQHEFVYRWFRGPPNDLCANESCIRRSSFSPHDWSKHALGGSTDCALQCVSTQSSLYKCTFCNAKCFIDAWKTQYTIPRPGRSATPDRTRSGGSYSSFGGGGDSDADDMASQRSSGSKSPSYYDQPSTPRGGAGGYNNNGNASSSYAVNGADGEQGWVEICRDQYYLPTEADVGRKLKIEASAYSLDTGELLMSRVVKTDMVLARAPQPLSRKLVTAVGLAPSSSSSRFRVATYNLLAEIYATQQQYPYTDFWALSWEYRFQNLIAEILDASPDVLCLQEVQADHYENHVYPQMSDSGYEGVFKPKTRQSMGLAGKVDGCALFWRRTKFIMVESYSIEFNEVAIRYTTNMLGSTHRSDNESMQFINRLSKDNVAQLVVLEMTQPAALGRTGGRDAKQVCIANTHLYSNKDFPDVKLWQAWQLLQELESYIMSRGTNLPLIICGDFNSTPETAVYDLLSHQSVHPGHPDVNVTSANDDIPNVLPDAMNITHSFRLGSAYHTVLGEEPWVTNYTQNFKGVLDYIWYSMPNLRPVAVAPVPDETELTRNGEALPSTEYSSDHVMLIAEMQIASNGR